MAKHKTPSPTVNVVYLLHFDPPYEHARHYLGFAKDLGPRVNAHMHGKGARLTQVAHDAGCHMVLARVWTNGSKRLERQLKNRKNAPQLCPICQGLVGVQPSMLPDVPAYIPTHTETKEDDPS